LIEVCSRSDALVEGVGGINLNFGRVAYSKFSLGVVLQCLTIE